MSLELVSVNSNHKATEMTNSDWGRYDERVRIGVMNRKNLVTVPIYSVFGVMSVASVALFWGMFGIMRLLNGKNSLVFDAIFSSASSVGSFVFFGSIGLAFYFQERKIQKQVEIDDTVLVDRTTQIQALIEKNKARMKQIDQEKETMETNKAKLEAKNKELSSLLSIQKV